MTRFVAGTLDHIELYAQTTPTAPAVLMPSREVDFATFHREICNLAAQLDRMGVRAGMKVAVEVIEAYAHWVTILACEHLGAVTLSFRMKDVSDMETALAAVDMVFNHPVTLVPRAKRHHAMTTAWVSKFCARDLTPPQRYVWGATEPYRLVRSSGTTGHIKIMPHTPGMRSFHVGQYLANAEYDHAARFWPIGDYSLEAVKQHGEAALWMGCPVVLDERPAGIVLDRWHVSHVSGVAYRLVAMERGLPERFVAPRRIQFHPLGGELTAKARERLSTRFKGTVIETYGAEEVGTMATMIAPGVGLVEIGVELEVVDEAGKRLCGREGEIRVRCAAGMALYVNHDAANNDVFRDGWFHPGDRGIDHGDLKIEVLGRIDELLNFRGHRFMPGPLEQSVLERMPVIQACLDVIVDQDGIDQCWLAVVPEKNHDEEVLRKSLVELMPKVFEVVQLVIVERIITNNAGKVRRKLMRRRFEELAGR